MSYFNLSKHLAAATLAGSLAVTEAKAEYPCINGGQIVGIQNDCNAMFGNKEPARGQCQKANAQQITDLQKTYPNDTVQVRVTATDSLVCREPK